MDERQYWKRRLPALGVFAGGLVYALLPAGAFGAHDFAARATITGAVAGVTAVLILVLSEGLRPSDSPTRALARRGVGALRSRGSLVVLARSVFVRWPLVLTNRRVTR